MPGKVWLVIVFLLSLLVSLVFYAPARLMVEQLPDIYIEETAVELSSVQGPWWRAALNWRWQEFDGELRWSLVTQGLAPALRVRLTGTDDLRLSAVISGNPSGWRLADMRGSVPLAPFSERVDAGGAEGRLDIAVMQLRVRDGNIVDLQGVLEYSGGVLTWPQGGRAEVPPLTGLLVMESDRPRMTLDDPQGQRLMQAQVENQQLSFEVLRAWPLLLGVSQGGGVDDVVFRMSQPFQLP